MKKILSLTLVLAMVMSMGITTAFAAGNWEGGTQVTYTATGAEEWTVTVPATLAPGAAGDVTAAGTWGSNRKLVVTADDSVKLTNSINSADYKDLAVTFADINLVGDNTQAVSETKQVSVAAMPADALFGTWSGTFYYDVEMVDVAVPGATFSMYLPDPTCHRFIEDHEMGCYSPCYAVLTWDEVKLEENGTKYGYDADIDDEMCFFTDCKSLASITLPEGMISIPEGGFFNCTSLTSVTLPTSVTRINGESFCNCTSLTTIIYKGTVEQWNAITFAVNDGSGMADWNDSCPEITVTCTDGTIIIPAYGS